VEHEFWVTRWSEGQLGFHEGKPNDLLSRNIERVELGRPLRILVPLAGKAFDLWWLASRGHDVVGVEFVPLAVDAFFSEAGLSPTVSERDGLKVLSANGVSLVCGDIFRVSPEGLGTFDLIYDRAALVALDPSTRGRYADLMRSMLSPDGRIFLVAFAYDQTRAPGPPWSVDEAQVRSLFERNLDSHVEHLSTRETHVSPRLLALGLGSMQETAYLITTAG
jgi:thiopurine S-methyltransferase